MIKIFISQVMNGRTDESVKEERDNITNKLKSIIGDDIVVLDTFYTDIPDGAHPCEYISRSIHDLGSADLAYFAEGYNHSHGCTIEAWCCKYYNIPIISYEMRDDRILEIALEVRSKKEV